MVTREQRVRKHIRDGETLEVARNRLMLTLEHPGCPPAAQASIAAALVRIERELATLKPKVEQGDPIDDLAARRKARRRTG